MYPITKKRKRKPCKVCGKVFWWISINNYCKKCLAEKINLARLEIKHKSGPIYEKWKIAMMKGLEQ